MWGCTAGAAESEEHREATGLVLAIEQLRFAEPASVLARLGELRALGCQRHCELKRLCLGAFEQRQTALEAARAAAATGDPGRLSALERAERSVRDSQVRLEACNVQEFELARRSSIPLSGGDGTSKLR